MNSKKKPNGGAKPAKEDFTPDELKLIHGLLDAKPEIKELTVSEINIDYSYQTRYRERIRNLIKSNLKEGLLSVLKVAQRPDGTYWAMDGATRVIACQDRGEKVRKLRCEIYPTDGPKVEALVFAYVNGTRSRQATKLETSLQAYSIAGVDKGFGKAVHDCGFDLVGGGKFRHLSGPGYVKQAWDLDGDGTAMKKALYSCKDAWRDKFRLTGYMVLGVAKLYHAMRYKAIDEQVRRLLHRKSPEDIMDIVQRRWATTAGKARIHPDDKPRLIAIALAKEINKNPGKSGMLDLNKLAEEEERVGA